jgi:hypothetical protein
VQSRIFLLYLFSLSLLLTSPSSLPSSKLPPDLSPIKGRCRAAVSSNVLFDSSNSPSICGFGKISCFDLSSCSSSSLSFLSQLPPFFYNPNSHFSSLFFYNLSLLPFSASSLLLQLQPILLSSSITSITHASLFLYNHDPHTSL